MPFADAVRSWGVWPFNPSWVTGGFSSGLRPQFQLKAQGITSDAARASIFYVVHGKFKRLKTL